MTNEIEQLEILVVGSKQSNKNYTRASEEIRNISLTFATNYIEALEKINERPFDAGIYEPMLSTPDRREIGEISNDEGLSFVYVAFWDKKVGAMGNWQDWYLRSGVRGGGGDGERFDSGNLLEGFRDEESGEEVRQYGAAFNYATLLSQKDEFNDEEMKLLDKIVGAYNTGDCGELTSKFVDILGAKGLEGEGEEFVLETLRPYLNFTPYVDVSRMEGSGKRLSKEEKIVKLNEKMGISI